MNEQTPPPALTLRPVAPEDEGFLFTLYASTRADEFAPMGLSEAQLAPLLRMQFEAQRRAYNARYPAAGHQLILLDGQPAGRIWVAREADAFTLVDIALLPAARGGGLGTRLIKDLIAEADSAARPVRLTVLKSNDGARRLYERLGFVVTADLGVYWEMEHRAPAATR
ncbi:MAG TPA: GNAT family N-acetyltransferase [Pyrinomonadaceae bacterium]|jgi:ribosomal protein S18 acetylase RimI-like enzyme